MEALLFIVATINNILFGKIYPKTLKIEDFRLMFFFLVLSSFAGCCDRSPPLPLLRRVSPFGIRTLPCFAIPPNPHSLPRASCAKLLYQSVSVSELTPPARYKIFAERRGFEPRKPFWSLHAFQACLFNHSSISPFALFCATFQNRLQNYIFFVTYARKYAIFFKKNTYFSRKRRFELFFVASITFLGSIFSTSPNFSATPLMNRLSFLSPRCGTGAI